MFESSLFRYLKKRVFDAPSISTDQSSLERSCISQFLKLLDGRLRLHISQA